jgi:hypothetical protein
LALLASRGTVASTEIEASRISLNRKVIEILKKIKPL